jgi:uncharacterized membrane protein
MRFWATFATAIFLIGCGGQPAPKPGEVTPSPASTTPAPAVKGVTPLSAQDDPLLAFRGPLEVRGTEPFWSVSVDPAKVGVTFRNPENENGQRFAYAAPRAAAGGVVLIAAGDLTLALRAQACSDGMSDTAYPMSATVTIGAQAPLRGCAHPVWSGDLAQLIGAIDACLDKAGDRLTPVVYGARTRTGATIRLSKEGKVRDCKVSPAGEATLGPAKPADETVRLPSESYPIFYRAPQPNPGGACLEAEIARGPKGEDLGWLSDGDGC